MTYEINLAFHHEHAGLRPDVHPVVAGAKYPMTQTSQDLSFLFIMYEQKGRVKYPLKIAAIYLSTHNTARHFYVPQPQRCSLHGFDDLQSCISLRLSVSTTNSNPLRSYAICYEFSY